MVSSDERVNITTAHSKGGNQIASCVGFLTVTIFLFNGVFGLVFNFIVPEVEEQ